MYEKRPDPLRGTRDFLYQIRDKRRRIRNLEKRLELHKQAIELTGIDMRDEIDQLSYQIETAKADCARSAVEISDKISLLEDDRSQMVLIYRYIDLISDWNEIATLMGMTKAAVQKLHGQAIPRMKTVLEQ